MKELLEHFTLERGIYFTVWSFFTALLFIFLIFIASDKPIRGYYLSGDVDSIEIKVDIDNAPDNTIPLIGVDYDEAVELVNKLNEPYNK